MRRAQRRFFSRLKRPTVLRMASLEITNLVPAPRVELLPGAPLLAAIQAAGLDWAYACGGRGRCTTCRLHLTAGAENLLPLTAAEDRFRALGRLPAGSRLACQAGLAPHAPPTAELRAVVPPEGQLSHVKYA